VRRHDQLQRFVDRMLLEANVATALPNDNPAVPTECPNHLPVVQARDLHTAISMTSASAGTAGLQVQVDCLLNVGECLLSYRLR
jgi:hypothetical protein